jgi:FixJ family two-component response regulator
LVLLAEDDVATRTVIRRILESVGHRVEAHETADACLAWLRARGAEELPTVVVTDVMMPGLNGIAFTKVLREEYPQLPVILVSGYADVRDRVPEMLAARPVILEKPFTATALHDAMRRATRPSGSGAQA